MSETTTAAAITDEQLKPEVGCRHVHRCQSCGTIWGHGNMMAGDVSAHECPKCGVSEWRIYRGQQQPQRAAATPKPKPGFDWMVLLGIAMLVASAVVLMRYLKRRNQFGELAG
ncbi:MAG: hypothetical protein ACRD3S_22550 [Terracidiphilus sp.]